MPDNQTCAFIIIYKGPVRQVIVASGMHGFVCAASFLYNNLLFQPGRYSIYRLDKPIKAVKGSAAYGYKYHMRSPTCFALPPYARRRLSHGTIKRSAIGYIHFPVFEGS